ncbi:MAG: glutamate-1-semialdehyde 2,1-aminomutase [Solirubrobacteraceae bacterium]
MPAGTSSQGPVAPRRSARSHELTLRALRAIPGAVNSPVRAMRSIGREPIWIESGRGAELLDVDGNAYIDYVCSWGPLIHGHAHPAVLEAIASAAARGSSFGAPTEAEVALAEEIASRMRSIELVRSTSSGTEASMTAIRIARAATGRDAIVKFAGAYHGHADALLAEAGSGVATAGGGRSVPSSPGVPAASAADTIVVPWNDIGALEAALASRPVAAVLAEPLPANMGLVPPASGFLQRVRAIAHEAGALLLLDEVISGFRVARGGAQELADVDADLTIMGKVIGGGLPAGAVGGPAHLMELLAPAGEVYQAGTLSGNPLAVAAGRASLALLDDAAYPQLERTTRQLAEALRRAADGHPVEIVWRTGLLSVFFSDAPVLSFADAARCDLEAHACWCRSLLEHGVYPPPSQFEAWFPSLAHTEEQIERTEAAARAAFAELR